MKRIKSSVVGTVVLVVLLVACVSNEEFNRRLAEIDAAKTPEQVDTAVKKADAVLSGAEDKLDAGEKGGQVVVPFIPPPYNTFVGYGLALALGLFRARVQKQRAILMAKSIEKAKAVGGLTLTPQQVAILNAEQTPAIKAIVDEAQGKKVGMPL